MTDPLQAPSDLTEQGEATTGRAAGSEERQRHHSDGIRPSDFWATWCRRLRDSGTSWPSTTVMMGTATVRLFVVCGVEGEDVSVRWIGSREPGAAVCTFST